MSDQEHGADHDVQAPATAGAPTRWVRAQQVSLLAVDLAVMPSGTREEMQDRIAQAERIAALLDMYRGDVGHDWPLLTLPPATLHLLRKAAPALRGCHATKALPKKVEAALSMLVGDRGPVAGAGRARGKPPVIPRARAVAHMLLDGAGDAHRVVAAARNFFKSRGLANPRGARRAWVDVADIGELEQPLHRLRQRNASTGELLAAIADLMAVIDGVPYREQIENAMLQLVFAWPLLVRQGKPGAVALPLRVDVELNGQCDTLKLGHHAFDLDVPTADPGCEPQSWSDHLRRSRRAAADLWLSSHGNHGRFRRSVRFYNAVFDFTEASEIITGAMGGQEPLPLIGGSAAAYLAQVLLARLLGGRPASGSMVTGLIGPRVLREVTDPRAPAGEPPKFYECLDHEFLWPGGVRDKLGYVFDTHLVERMVVPSDNQYERERRDLSDDLATGGGAWVQTARLIAVARLSNVADVVQEEGWRRTTYIRCPEAEWAVHSPAGRDRLRRELRGGRKCHFDNLLNQLHGSDSTAVIADCGSVTAAAVLHHINGVVRAGEGGEVAYPIPMLSYAVVRVQEQGDAEFWRMLWRVIGAPREDFERLCRCRTSVQAAGVIEAALNVFEPDDGRRSHRAPDVLVLAGWQRLVEAMERWDHPLSRPLMPAAVIKHLIDRNNLNISPDRTRCPRVGPALGQTRLLLLLNEDRDDLDSGRDPDNICEADLKVLRHLGVYRYSFNQALAAAVLVEEGLRGSEVRARLDELVQMDALRYHAGEYHLPLKLHRNVRELEEQARRHDGPHERQTLARRDYRAAIAFAPYLSSRDTPSMGFVPSLFAESVAEAMYHLEQSFTTLKPGRDVAQRNLVRQDIHGVLRAGPTADWIVVNQLMMKKEQQSHDEAFELAYRLLDAADTTELPPHPIWLAEAAEARAGVDPNQVTPDRGDEVVKLFERAIEACDTLARLPDKIAKATREQNLLEVLPRYSVFLARHNRSGQVEAVDDRIWGLREDWTRLRGEWIELQAERVAAAPGPPPEDRGLDGLLAFCPTYYQLPFKLMGAALIHDRVAEDAQAWFDDLAQAFVDQKQLALQPLGNAAVAWAKDLRAVAGGRKEPSVLTCWERSCTYLNQRWEENPRLLRELAKMQPGPQRR